MQSGQQDGIVGRGPAQGLIVWILCRPSAFIPAPAKNPLAWRRRSDALSHLLRRLLRGRHILEVQTEDAFPEFKKVSMSINDSGHDRGPMKVPPWYFGAKQPFGFFAAAHPCDM